MKSVIALAFAVIVMCICAGLYYLVEVQLRDLPLNPVSLQSQSHRDNLEDIKDLTLIGVGAGGLLAAGAGALVLRNVTRTR